MTKFNLLVITTLLTLNSSCTLNKRNLPKEDNEDSNEKVTISNPTPNPTDLPTPVLTKVAEPNPSSTQPQTQNTTETEIKKTVLNDAQIPLDIEEFNHPKVPIKRQGLYRGKPFAAFKKNFTGLVDLSNLAFTDSSNDYLIPFLRLEKEGGEGKSKYKKSSFEWSKQIASVKIMKLKNSQFSVEIIYEGDDKILTTVILTGTSQMNDRYALLTEKESDNIELKLNSVINGELRCIDQNFQPICANYHLKLIMKKTDGDDSVEAILRTSSFRLSFEAPKSHSKDPHFLEVNDELKSAHFTNLEMQSFAIINGRSEFSIKLLADTKKYIFINGPLLTNFGNSPTDIQLNSSDNNYSILTSELLPQLTKDSSLLNDEDFAYLVSNDGSGSLVIKLRIQNKTLNSQNDFILNISRSTIPTIDPTEETLYFKP